MSSSKHDTTTDFGKITQSIQHELDTLKTLMFEFDFKGDDKLLERWLNITCGDPIIFEDPDDQKFINFIHEFINNKEKK